ncbi:Signal transduction histidine kinase [Lachnospiraceae bacterium C7]|nr:Signal transduction histidine kinase [Lachnospiraceae bacterium C7]
MKISKLKNSCKRIIKRMKISFVKKIKKKSENTSQLRINEIGEKIFVLKKEKKTESLYFYIMKSFLLFLMLVVFLILIFYLTSNNLEREIQNNSTIDYAINKEKDNFKSGNYEGVSLRRSLGKKGYFEVLNEDGSCIYASNRKLKSYTKDLLDYIPDVENNSYVKLSYMTYKDKTDLVIFKYKTKYDKKNEYIDEKLAWIMVLDENLDVIYTNRNMTDENRLSNRELTILSTGYEKGGYLQKYQFKTKLGQTRYAILHVYKSVNVERKVFYMYIIMVTIIGIIFIVILVSLTFSMRRRVVNPVNLIREAMRKVEKGESYDVIDYYGTYEFMDMCDSFNSMSTKLRISEQERMRVEEQKQKMLADISHDLKTPITVISGYTKALSDGLVPKEKEMMYIDAINQKAELLSGLINSFYEYSKLDHPEFRLVREYGDVCEYFREYIASKYDELEILGYGIEIDLPEKEVMAKYDKMHLKRVFENLITNSVKHNKKGTVILVSLEDLGENIKIKIGDNGSGVPEQLKKTIFQPFVVGDESRNSRQGTGLGLSIAQKIVEAHGGKIRLVDGIKQGWNTLFEINLPKGI